MKTSLIIIFLIMSNFIYGQNFKADLAQIQAILQTNNYAITMTLNVGQEEEVNSTMIEIYKSAHLYKAKTKDFELLITDDIQVAKIYEPKVLLLTEIGEEMKSQLEASMQIESILEEDLEKVEFVKNEEQVNYYKLPNEVKSKLRNVEISFDIKSQFYKTISYEQLNLNQEWERMQVLFTKVEFNKTYSKSFFEESQFIIENKTGYAPQHSLQEYTLINQLTK